VSRTPFAAVLCLLTLSGCGVDEQPAPPPRPNILLVSVDALRADHLSCYGYERPTTPFLDRFAASGIRFENASVNTHGTPPSHTTMLSGLYQETHRVAWTASYSDVAKEGIPEGVTLVQQILHENGYRTLGVTDGGHVAGVFGFARGFDVYDDKGGGVRAVTDRMEKLVAASPHDKPLFMFLHTYEVHSPYQPPEGYRGMFGTFASDFDPTSENLVKHANNALWSLKPADLDLIRARYDEELRYTDDTLRDFIRKLRALGALRNALVIVTGDHGEEFAEHGGLTHRDTLYQELVHVPLIAVGTGSVALEKGRVESALVSLVSVAPSILSIAGIAPPSSMEGPVILPKVTGRRDGPVFAQYGGRRYSIREGRFKLIETTTPKFRLELYDLDGDPGETHDIAAERDDLVQRLYLELRKWKSGRHPIDGSAPFVRIGKEEMEKLKSLGYLGGQ